MVINLSIRKTTDAEYFEAFKHRNNKLIRKFMNECRSSFNAAISKSRGVADDDFIDEVLVVSIEKLWTRITNETLRIEQLEVPLKDYLIGIGKYAVGELEKTYSSVKEKREGEKKIIEFVCRECGNWVEWTHEEYKSQKKAPDCCGAKMEKVVSHKHYVYDDDPSIDKQMWDSVTVALERITSKCKELLTLIYWDRKAYEEILELTEYKTVSGAKTQKYKCMQKIKAVATQRYNESKI